MQTQIDLGKAQNSTAVLIAESKSISSGDLNIEQAKPQLDALTALRFFACAAIIFLHSAWFFFDINFLRNWQLDEGVAFFFVLSGFILTYVYPNLQGKENIKRFLVNRLGRMVPSNVVLTFITLAVLPCSCATAGAFFANLFSLQSWIPRREYYFGLNAPAWSISAEIFFSFAFVFLIKPWRSGWIGKVALGILITIIACLWAHLFMISDNQGFLKFNDEYLLKINPLVRTADFILGMATAHLWMQYKHLIKLSKWAATFIEITLISLILFEITQINTLIEKYFTALKHYPSLTYWMVHGGCAPIFCAVIFMMALERGYIAKLFTNPIFVWLGEISFSMYMLHFIVIQCLNFYLPEFGHINWLITYPIYLTVVVLLSYLNFNLIEDPFRHLIKTLVFSSKNYRFSLSSLSKFFRPNLVSLIAASILVVILITASGAYVNNSQSRFQYTEINIGRSIDFEDYFRLEKISMASAMDGSKINLTWRSLKPQTVNRLIEISCIGKTGNMLEQYEQKDMFPLKLKSGETWSQTIYMPASANQRNKWDKLGLRLSMHVDDAKHHHQYRILAPHGGSVDWWATRLTIPINKQAL